MGWDGSERDVKVEGKDVRKPYSVVSHCDTMVTRVISRTKRKQIVIINYSKVFGEKISEQLYERIRFCWLKIIGWNTCLYLQYHGMGTQLCVVSKFGNRTCTRVTHFGNTAGLTIPVAIPKG